MKLTYERKLEELKVQTVCSDLKNKIYGKMKETNVFYSLILGSKIFRY